MLVTTYTNAVQFLDAAELFLETDETVNSVMLGLCLAFKTRGETGQNTYAAVGHDGQIVAALMMTPPYDANVVGAQDSEALKVLAEALIDQPIGGVNGKAGAARTFADAWAAKKGISHWIKLNMRLYALSIVVAPPPIRGTMRQAAESDLELTTRWFIDFEQEALGETANAEEMRMGAAGRIARGDLFLWEAGGEPVTMVGRTRPTRHTMTINSVYTPPEKRRHGYATACVAAVSQHILDAGFSKSLLFTNLANPTANNIYQKIGYHPVCDVVRYGFEPVSG